MVCNLKNVLDAVTVAQQVLAANGFASFATNTVLNGCAIRHIAGATDVTLAASGLYQVFFDADVEPNAAGEITLQLLNNNVAVTGAQATFSGTADTTSHVHFAGLVRVRPSCVMIDNTAMLQVQTNAGATITNAQIIVVKIA